MAASFRRVTLFSSIPEVAESLLQASSPSLVRLDVIEDAALGGYGGTVSFDPSKLKPATRLALSQAEVLVSEPAVVAALLRFDAAALPKLRWCQSTYAGVDPLFDSRLAPLLPLPWTLTRFAGKFGPPIAEWCLARIIEHERGFASTSADQRDKQWAGSREAVTQYRYLSTLTLSILGCGDIGRCIARAAGSFGMKTVGYTRTPREPGEGGVDKYVPDLKSALQAGDYVVSVLPSTPTTKNLLSGDSLSPAAWESGGKCPVLLNVGRGDVIDESSLLRALDEGYISAAILDVFETEPLPQSSRLWERTDVVVSPHVSGLTQAKDVPEVFLENLRRYIAGDELLYTVDWSKGY